jgi:hypothetical protein
MPIAVFLLCNLHVIGMQSISQLFGYCKNTTQFIIKVIFLSKTMQSGLQIFTIKRYLNVLFNDIHYNMRLESFRCEVAHLPVRNNLRKHSVKQ